MGLSNSSIEIVDIIIDLRFARHQTIAAPTSRGGRKQHDSHAAGSRSRDWLCHEAVDDPDGAHGGRPRHADGRIAAAVLAPDRARVRRHRYPQKGARARRGPGAVSRPACARRAAARPLLPSRHDALLRQGRGRRHPLLLSRLEVRHRRPLPRTALRARGRPVQGQGAAALVSGREALRPDLRLFGPGREKAGAAAL